MSSSSTTRWHGVFPAITTQMHPDGSLDLEGTASHAVALIESGVAGIIFLGSLGENQALAPDEKRQLLGEMVPVVKGRVPVLSGVAESRTSEACRYVRDLEDVLIRAVAVCRACVGLIRRPLIHGNSFGFGRFVTYSQYSGVSFGNSDQGSIIPLAKMFSMISR